jgi:dTDP-4-amino-4,6-dideoxygalactose transaminase
MADIIDWAGLLPRFCDVDSETLGISPATVQPCINENTALILAPHPVTHLCDIDGIEHLARKYGLPLCFDSAEACGGMHKGRMIGGFGDCEAFSMHPRDVLHSCEGGYITTDNDDIAQTLKLARSFGFFGRDNIVMLGHNAKLNELHAAMGLATLAGLERRFADNRRIHLAYQAHLADLPGVAIISYDRAEKRNWKSVLVRLDDAWPFSREETLRVLGAENIHARPCYSPPQHVSVPRQAGKGGRLMPVTEKAATCHLLLPCGSTVSEEDAVRVSQVLHSMLALRAPLKKRLSAGAAS